MIVVPASVVAQRCLVRCQPGEKLNQSLAIMGAFLGAQRVVEFAHISGMVLAVVDLHGDRINLWRQCRNIVSQWLLVKPKRPGRQRFGAAVSTASAAYKRRYQHARAYGSSQFDERSFLHETKMRVPLQSVQTPRNASARAAVEHCRFEGLILWPKHAHSYGEYLPPSCS